MNKNRIWFFIIALVVCLLGLYFIWRPSGLLDVSSPEDVANVAVEFHGMIFDVILFGVILTLYEFYSDRKQSIQRYKDEIDDFRGWDEKEAVYRIVGSITRLNKEKVYDINLSHCYLVKADLIDVDLNGADLMGANLIGANLIGANLMGANLKGANLKEANLLGANLKRANLMGTKLNKANLNFVNLSNASLIGVDLSGADLNVANLSGADLRRAIFNEINVIDINLSGANLSGINLNGAVLLDADLSGANLSGGNLSGVILKGANLKGADLSQVKNLDLNLLLEASSLYEIKGIDSLIDGLKKMKPCLFTKEGCF